MASITLKYLKTLVIDEWIRQADELDELVDRINDTYVWSEPEELQAGKRAQLESLLSSKKNWAKSPVRVRLLIPVLLFHLVEISANQGDWLSAANHYKRAYEVIEEIVAKLNFCERIDLTSRLETLKQLQQDSFPFIEARAALQSGEETAGSGAWQQGLNELQEALAMFQKTNDVNGKAHASLGIGDVHKNFGDYEIAQSYYWDAVRFFRRKGNKSGEAAAQLRYGTALIDLQSYAEATPHLRSAREIFAEIGDEDQIAVADKWLALAAQMEQSAGEKI